MEIMKRCYLQKIFISFLKDALETNKTYNGNTSGSSTILLLPVCRAMSTFDLQTHRVDANDNVACLQTAFIWKHFGSASFEDFFKKEKATYAIPNAFS